MVKAYGNRLSVDFFNVMKNTGKKLQSSCNAGFTLIELMIALAIMGMISALLLTQLNPFSQIQKANDARRKSDLSQIQKALELYYNDKGQYPQSNVNYQIVFGGSPVLWGSAWQPYTAKVPADPSTASRIYAYYSTGQAYWLYASLERGISDPQVCSSGGTGICASISANGIAAGSCGR